MTSCKATVRSKGLRFHYHQCTRPVVPGSEYCKIHHPDNVAKRQAERHQAWEIERQRDNRKWTATHIGLLVIGHLETTGQYHVKDWAKAKAAHILQYYTQLPEIRTRKKA